MDRRIFLKGAVAGSAALAASESLLAAISGRSDDEIESRVKDLVARMTLDEKIEQMAGRIDPGDVMRRRLDPDHPSAWFTPENQRLGIPRFIMIDGPRGMGMKGSTCFPVGICRGASFDPGLERRVGQAAGYEVRVRGVNVLLAPCINVVWHPRWGRSQESYGEDPLHLGAMGASFVRGVQEHVMACPKHYAVNNLEENRFKVNAVVEERTLRELFLPHFKECVEAGAASIMSAYNYVNGPKAGQNPHLCRGILKEEWGFEGFVVSDWILAVNDGVEAVNAGLDVEMPAPLHLNRRLKKAVADGRVKLEHIDEAVSRILRAKLRFISADMKAGYDLDRVAGPEHTALAKEAALKGLVLLKNEGKALPLGPEVKTIAVLGRLATRANLGDQGSSAVRPPYTVSPLEGLTRNAPAGVKVVHSRSGGVSSAQKLAREADAVIVVAGFTFRDEGEQFDRKRLELHDREVRLIQAAAAANDRVIVALVAGSAVAVEDWLAGVEAVLMAWYPGMEGGNAIAEIVFGKANPSGKLPIAFPKSADQLWEFDNRSKEFIYGRHHGYRWFDKQGFEPRFPFGFGLSYTSFELSSLRLSKKSMGREGRLSVSVEVKNTGAVKGAEVVQFYVGCKGSAVERPVKDLKGFCRVELEPGESRTASFELAAADLAYFCPEQNAWVVEEIEYELMAGTSSAEPDLKLRDTFSVSRG